MPEYNSKEMLREKLLKSLKESGSGFDLSWFNNIKISLIDKSIVSWKKVFSILSIINKI